MMWMHILSEENYEPADSTLAIAKAILFSHQNGAHEVGYNIGPQGIIFAHTVHHFQSHIETLGLDPTSGINFVS